MNRLLLKPTMTVMVGSLLCSSLAAAQESPTTIKAERVRITQGPQIERIDPDFAIIKWTSNNPGGSPVHLGIVRYGTGPKKLSQTAQSPIRLNPGHSYTVFRVRMEGLKPRTTYYYYGLAQETQSQGRRCEERGQAFHHTLRARKSTNRVRFNCSIEHDNALSLINRNHRVHRGGRMAAPIAHEINNPLASAINAVYLVKRDPALDESLKSNRDCRAGIGSSRTYHETNGWIYKEVGSPAAVDPAEVLKQHTKSLRTEVE